MKPQPTILYLALAIALAAAVLMGDMLAATAWGVAMTLCFLNDAALKKATYNMVAATLFINAHNGKWPSKKAEDEAAAALAQFEQRR